MATLITAHSTQPGQEAIYEKFLQYRKLWFVRHLPGMQSCKVYRTEKRFDPSGLAPTDIHYSVIAIIEFDGDIDKLSEVYSNDSFVDFMGEYMHLLEDDPVLYQAHEIPELGQVSAEEFKALASNWAEQEQVTA